MKKKRAKPLVSTEYAVKFKRTNPPLFLTEEMNSNRRGTFAARQIFRTRAKALQTRGGWWGTETGMIVTTQTHLLSSKTRASKRRTG